MSNLDDDLFDDDLAAALRARAGGGSHAVDGAHEAVLHRASTIRRRRAAVGGAGVAVLAVAGMAVLSRGTDEIGTAETVATVVDTATPTSVESSPVVTDPGDDPPGTTIELVVPVPTSDATTTAAPDISTSSAPGAAVPTTTAASGGSTTTGAPTTTPSTTTTTTLPNTTTTVEAGPDPFTRTYSSAGGSITVSWNGTALSLDAVTPAPGYSAEVEDQRADRVRVRFEGDDDSRIEIRVEDGEVREQIE
jgi:hypothetical protein